MKKRIFAVMWAVILVVMCGITGLAEEAEAETITETVGNVMFDIPSYWTPANEMTGDTTIKSYIGDAVMLIVAYMPTDMEDYDEQTQRFLLGAVTKTFEESENYTELSNADCKFEGRVANVRTFTYDKDGEVKTSLAAVMYTGKGIAMFSCEAESSIMAERLSICEDIIESIKTVDSGENVGAAGEDNGKYSKYPPNIYKVGSDIPAGEYVVFTEGRSGYFCVSSDSNQDDIIFNDNFDYNSIITVNDGEYLELSRCYAIPIGEKPDVSVNASGMFKVGLHIPAGEYTLDAGGNLGYYCIYSDSRQDDIVSNDNFEGRNYVTVSDGQYLELSRCKFTEPPAKPE